MLSGEVYFKESRFNSERMKIITKKIILSRLRKYKETSPGGANIKNIGVFGSYSRGEETPQSDLDVFVVMRTPKLFDLVRIRTDLEQLFKKRIDIVALTKSSPTLLKQEIRRTGIYV
jgi:predicted nucleotidyltransferase